MVSWATTSRLSQSRRVDRFEQLDMGVGSLSAWEKVIPGPKVRSVQVVLGGCLDEAQSTWREQQMVEMERLVGAWPSPAGWAPEGLLQGWAPMASEVAW